MPTIIENGEILEVTETQAARLKRRGLIYYCDVKDGGHFLDKSGCGFWHTHDDGFGRVISALKMMDEEVKR